MKNWLIYLMTGVLADISDSGRLELDSRDCQLDSCCSLEIGEMDISVYGGAIAWIIDQVSLRVDVKVRFLFHLLKN